VLKAKVPLPKGTKGFRYTVTVAASGASQSYGPYEARVPRGGPGFRFIAAGGTAFYKGSSEGVDRFLAKLRQERPDVFIHTGNCQNCNAWDFMWTEDFFRVAQPTFAGIPLLPVASIAEMMSPDSFARTFYFPPADADWSQWTVAIGNVRLVAIEAFSQADDKTGAGVKWLEDVLKNAKEDYVLVLNAHATGCAPIGIGKVLRTGCNHTTVKIDPLLVKYKVTATIGNMYRGYNRIEPPPGEGVPTILTGKAGGYLNLSWKITLTRIAQAKAASGDEHYVLFAVKPDCLEMKTVSLSAGVIDTRTFQPRK
jgi:hypothetical protein